MAKRPNIFKMRQVRVNSILQAGALASNDVIVGAVINAAADTYRLISVHAAYAWGDLGALVDHGCVFGLAHSDYSAAEVEECLESITAIDLGDKVAQEQANRLVREIGVIQPAAAVSGSSVYNDGRPVKTRLNWLMSIGDQLNLWIRNSSGTVWTTNSEVSIDGKLWIRDGH